VFGSKFISIHTVLTAFFFFFSGSDTLRLSFEICGLPFNRKPSVDEPITNDLRDNIRNVVMKTLKVEEKINVNLTWKFNNNRNHDLTCRITSKKNDFNEYEIQDSDAAKELRCDFKNAVKQGVTNFLKLNQRGSWLYNVLTRILNYWQEPDVNIHEFYVNCLIVSFTIKRGNAIFAQSFDPNLHLCLNEEIEKIFKGEAVF